MNVLPNLTSLEFAQENAFFFTPVTGKFDKLDLYDYQKNLLETFDKNRFVLVKHSRQMGITTLLKIYLANSILNNYNKPKTFVLISNNLLQACDVLEDIKRLVKQSYDKDFIVDNKRELTIENGNRIMVKPPSPEATKSFVIDEIIIDNVNYVNTLESLFSCIIPTINTNSSKIILISSGRPVNEFLKKLFLPSNDNFVKKTITWEMNPTRGKEWYDNMKKDLGEDLVRSEIDLIDIDEKPKIKKSVSFRLETDLLETMKTKLKYENISLSDYLRNLIKEDLSNNH